QWNVLESLCRASISCSHLGKRVGSGGEMSTRIINRVFAVLLSVMIIGVGFSPVVSAQVNSALSGTGEEPGMALMHGLTITETNGETGVDAPKLTNDAGSYSFPALMPGTHRLKAELSGFSTTTVSGIELGAGLPIRQNFVLEIGTAGTSVNV